jgi:hypothetical protein
MRQTLERETVSAIPDNDKSLIDYFGKDYVYEEHKGNPIFQAFNRRSKRLNEICREKFLDIGEAQCMLGCFWMRLKYYEFDIIEEWLKNNSRKNIKILYPELHEHCMKDKKYSNWYERGTEEN